MASGLQRLHSVEEKYAFIKYIGKGSYAEVYMVVPIDKIEKRTRYALKRINLPLITDDALREAEREANLLSSLQHVNIVRYIESFQSWDFHLNIVMIYYEGGDLYTKINQKKSDGQMFEETKVIEWCIQICMALEYIHEQNILHRDIKPQNIFLSKDEIIKLGDFGISRILKGAHDLATTMIGTPYYMSPEVFSNRPYNQKSDIWALGCCMHELVTLEHTFKASDMYSLIVQVTQGHIPKIRGNYSDELKSIIRDMLSVQPDDRPTANGILKHKYFKHHIQNMIKDISNGRRGENMIQRQKKASTMPLESELMGRLSMDSSNTARMAESHNEARKRRRQKVDAKRPSASDTMFESDTTFPSDNNSTPTNADELEKSERFLVETLTDHLDQIEEKHEENDHHVQRKHEFTSASKSSPGRMNTTEYRPLAIEPAQNQDQYAMNCRFSDIGNMPDQTLLPITGYTDKPLTSLEDAIRLVRDLLANIDTVVRVARENAQNRHGSLSVDESAAIHLYTMETLPLDRCLYYILNKTLRSVNRRDLVPWFPYLKLLMTALWKLPSFQGIVWRGIKGVNLSKQYEEGKFYTWWNLSSCTDSLTVLEKSNFLGTEGARTLFNIQCFNGKQIRQHSYVQDENEILLLPGTYFKVLGKVNAGADFHIIHIQQISPPYELISRPF